MDKRVILEMKGKKPEEIKDLVLDCCRSTSFTGITDKFCNLETLSVINAGLTSLKGFPKLPKLKKLDLSDNKISGDLDILKDNCPELTNLHLCANKIDKIEALEPLKNLSNLSLLDLTTCEVTSLENYREKVFKNLPNLKYLDGCDKNNEELNESSDDESDEESDEEVGLSYLQKSHIDEDSGGDDYAPGDEDPEDVVDEDDDDEDVDDDGGDDDDDDDDDDDINSEGKKGIQRGTKRKHEKE